VPTRKVITTIIKVCTYDAPNNERCFEFVGITEDRHSQVCKNTCFYDRNNEERGLKLKST